MTSKDLIIETDFNEPERVVMDFIKSAYRYCRQCPIGPKGDREDCITTALELVHYYTLFKFHPYSDHRYGLYSIQHIKEIDAVESTSKNEILIHTQKNQSVVPACLFTLEYKNKKWKISNVQIKKGIGQFYSVF